MPAVTGAVHNPVALIVPPVAVHVTDRLLLFVTVAVNCCVASAPTFAVSGETTIVIAVTDTVDVADIVGSATLVAIMV